MFGDRLKELRLNRNMTQAYLANILQVSNPTVAMWESNRRVPDIKTLNFIAQIFDIPVSFIMESRTFQCWDKFPKDRNKLVTAMCLPDIVLKICLTQAYGKNDPNELALEEYICFLDSVTDSISFNYTVNLSDNMKLDFSNKEYDFSNPEFTFKGWIYKIKFDNISYSFNNFVQRLPDGEMEVLNTYERLNKAGKHFAEIMMMRLYDFQRSFEK